MEDIGQPESLFNVTLDHEGKSHLRTAATWAKIVAIASLVTSGLSFLTAIIGGVTNPGQASTVIASGVSAGISALLNITLLGFANKTITGLNTINQYEFADGINQLRRYFRIMGILLIIALAFCILAVIGLLMSTGLSRA